MYKELQSLDLNNKLLLFVKKGIISISLLEQYNTYKVFLDNSLKYPKKTKAVERTSIDCNLSKYWVYSIVKRMES